MSNNQMSRTTRDMILKEDLGWLDDLQVHEIDGKLMLGDSDENAELPINVSHVMSEQEFVTRWLMPFALGNATGTNYFPHQEWARFTFNGTRSVLIVKKNEETGLLKPVLLVPPLITHNLSEQDFLLLRGAARQIHANSEDVMAKNDMNASLRVAEILADEHYGLKATRTTITDLISPMFFEKHGVIPEVEHKIYWIRDVIRKGAQLQTKPEDLNTARDILYRDHRKQPVSKDEYLFIHELSLKEFIIEDKLETAPDSVKTNASGQTEAYQAPEDPLEC
ncbi:hypothetical protein D3C81_714410 [compost metagenome]